MASILKVDSMQGVTDANQMTVSANNVTVQGEATATLRLQSGLAKCYCQFNGTNATVSSSFNTASVTDNGTGDFTLTFTNAFGTAAPCGPALAGRSGGSADDTYATSYDINTTDIQYNMLNDSGSKEDCGSVGAAVHGDLA